MAVYRETDGHIVREYALEIGDLVRKQTERALLEIVPTKSYGRAVFLDNQLQLTEADEYVYHEMLVHPCFTFATKRWNICILGGGDGCAVREVLKWPEVKSVDLIDWDKELTELFQVEYGDINGFALQDPRVQIENTDLRTLYKEQRSYDCILMDLIDLDPTVDEQRELWRDAIRLLKAWTVPGGAFVINLGGITPWETTTAAWTKETVEKELSWTVRLSKVFVPSFGREWCFLLATTNELPCAEELPSSLRYASDETIAQAFTWSPDYLQRLNPSS